MKRLSVILFAAGVLISSARAITAIHSEAPAAGSRTDGPAASTSSLTNVPAARWENTISFGLTLTRGNSDTLLTAAGFKAHRLNLTNEVLLTLDGTYGRSGSIKNNESLRGIGQYNHLFTDRVYGYARGEGFHDDVSDLAYRFTLSPGIGYYFIKRKGLTFAGEAGPGGVFERLDGTTKNYAAGRVAERFEYKWAAHARVWQTFEFLPQFDQGRNYLINAELGVETALTRHMSLKTVVQDNFINLPAPGRKQNDLKLISGIIYRF